MENITIILNTIPRTKKNQGQIVRMKNGRSILLPSKLYLAYEKECGNILPSQYKNLKINKPVNICCIFYCQSKRKIDLPNLLNAVDDMFVKYQVVEDDNRNIIAGHDGSRVYYDKLNPRIEIIISEINENENYTQW